MYKTEKLWVNSSICRIHDADELVKEFSAVNNIGDKDRLRMSLLAEETMCMAMNSLKNFEGELWLEKTENGYALYLEADVRETEGTADCVLSYPEGFMSKIAEMLNCSYVFEDISDMPNDLKKMLPDYLSYGMKQDSISHIWTGAWSLSAYRSSLKEHCGEEGIDRILDELEKSIVASLADDVTVGIIEKKIRLTICKTL